MAIYIATQIQNNFNCTIDIYYITVIRVSFNESSYSVNEELETIQLTLLLSDPSSTDITVHIREIEYTAKSKPDNVYLQHCYMDYGIFIGGSDYVAGKHSAIFHAGVTRASVDIDIINDNIFEDTELFNVTIMGNILPYGVLRGANRSATITIIDFGKLFMQ